ncbi:MAG: cation-transporting P-type ATPase [Ruminococcaceae bacterium]|nr:cation-transporting P-type ATPase [Oscillospiraceae bacterium]
MEKDRKNARNNWHALDAEEVVQRLGSNAAAGLSPKEAASRRRKAGICRLWQVSRASSTQILFGEFLDFAAILLMITAAVAAVFERGEEAAALCMLLVVSALIRTATSVTAQRIFESAAKEYIPRTTVIRGGKCISLTAEDVVPGDILFLSPGDTVVCDARLLSGELDVLENSVTSDNGICHKRAADVLPEHTACARRSNIAFASTSVVMGNARAVAVAVGENTYAYARRGYITVRCDSECGVLQKLSAWCRSVSLVMTAAVLLITLGGLFVGNTDASIDALFLSALALAVASMSEFLSVIASIILACSIRMLRGASEGGSVIKNPSAIETFAKAECVVFSSENLLRSDNLSIGAWYADAEMHDAPEPQKGAPALLALLQWCSLSSGGRTTALSAGGEGIPENELYELSGKFMHMYSGAAHALSASQTAAACTADDALHTALVPAGKDMYAYVCGSLDDVLPCCSNVMVNGVPQPITHEMRLRLQEDAAQYTRRCVRTVAVAMRLSPYNNLAKVSALHNKLTMIGYYTVLNPVELSLTRCVQKSRTGGIRFALLAEDSEKARYLAGEAGILGENDLFVEKTEENLLSDWLENPENRCAVICASTSEEKKTVVKSIREAWGNTVCIGSEMRDLASMSEADASAAAFPGGMHHPQCVHRRADALAGQLTDGKNARSAPAFEALRMIGYCKNALINLRGAAEYLLVSQSLRLTLTLAAVMLGMPLLSPLRILSWGLVLDYAAVLSLAFRTPRLGVLEVPAKQTDLPSLRTGILFPVISGVFSAVLIAAVPWIAEAVGFPADEAGAAYIFYAGGILASLAALCQTMFGGRTFGGIRIHAAYMIYLVLVIVVLIMSAFRQGVASLPMTPVHFAMAAVPAFVLFALQHMYKHTNNMEHREK